MKQLQLDLKERLLIVESENANEFFIMDKMPAGTYEIICKGSDLTEEIAKGLVDSIDEKFYANYNGDNWLFTALESFISAIQSKNYHWGENPDGEQPHNTGLINSYPTGHPLMDVSLEEAKKWQESESRIFNPEKCLIFEII